MDYDNWISSCTRIEMDGKCAGNNRHNHYFSSYYTPKTYKILVINNDTNEIKITDAINRTESDSFITLDVDTMEVTNNTEQGLKKKIWRSNILDSIFCVVSCTIFEIIYAIVIFNITKNKCNFKNIFIIFITNIIANAILNFSTIIIPLPRVISIIIIGILITLFEYFVYKKYFINMHNMSKKNILMYTLYINYLHLMFIMQLSY